jgi:tetratricopeptide (TPR) repeat protein
MVTAPHSSNRNINQMAYLVMLTLTFTGCNVGSQRHNVAGKQAFETGQYSAAINRFQQALTANPQNSDAYYNLGASFYALAKQSSQQSNNGQWLSQAEQLYRQAISLNDQHVDAHRGLAGLLIETKREQYAFDLMNEWKTRYPSATAPVVELARLYQEYGDNRRATDLLSDALKLDPNSVRALKAMGHVREVQGQAQLALDNYMRVLQLDNQQGEVMSRVASLQSQLASLPIPNGLTNGLNSGSAVNPQRYGAVAPYLNR